MNMIRAFWFVGVFFAAACGGAAEPDSYPAEAVDSAAPDSYPAEAVDSAAPESYPAEAADAPVSAAAPPPPTSAAAPEPDYHVQEVFFATDRNLTNSPLPDQMFGTERADEMPGFSGFALSYGVCEVSVPRDHRIGELEAPVWWRFEFTENPANHVVLLTTEVQDQNNFFAGLSDRINQFGDSSAFLFVHGYNVSFKDAARRTAQMAYDLEFPGAPMFYSWPSQGEISAYPRDEQSIQWAQANIREFLDNFFTNSDAQNVYLIAHSMGNRGLTRAIADLAKDKPSIKSRLREVILTAPDIDAQVFKRDIASALVDSARRVTLYASSEDLALKASKEVHGYPRAGESGEALLVFPGIETIDATSVETSFIGHSYFAESRSVLSDMYYLIHDGLGAEQRFMLRGVPPDGTPTHWEFKQ